MKRAIVAGLALALLLVVPVSARASVAVEDTVFGGTAAITYVEPNRYDGSLWARADCIIDDGSVGLSQYERLDGVDDWFFIGVTPSWSGGAATCHVKMLVLNGYHRPKTVATTTFSVLAG